MMLDDPPLILMIKASKNDIRILWWFKMKLNLLQERNRKTEEKKGRKPKNHSCFYAYTANRMLL